MLHRIRVTATIDADAASPDSIKAAQVYLIEQLRQRADIVLMGAVDWGSWRSATRQRRNGDLVIVQWVRALKG